MTILGYGEDALTLHALTNGLPGIFARLGDGSDPAKAIIFYRPSFGRRGSASTARAASQFGEFDAIVGTSRAVYLLEAKRPESGKLNGATFDLKPVQLRRHAAFRAYFDEWRRERPLNWPHFAARMLAIFRTRGVHLVPPPAGTTLAMNIAYVLDRLDACGPNLVDVLLFCRKSDSVPAPSTCGTFKVITYSCTPEDKSEFICLLT
jgi:hypothetical protein